MIRNFSKRKSKIIKKSSEESMNLKTNENDRRKFAK